MSALRNIRERKGFNISQLASRSGISGKTLLEYEEGSLTIPLAHARLLAKALWVEVDELMPPPGSVQPAAPQSTLAPQHVARPPLQRPVQAVSPVQINVVQSQAAPPVAEPADSTPTGGQSQQPQTRPVTAHQNNKSSRPDSRPARAPKVVPPATEGQIQELLQLARRLDISQEQLEERVGKSLTELMRPEATDWVKRLRAIADEIAPTSKVKYGRWPDANEDREAAYLARQRDAGSVCLFHLFNGEEFSGFISDFTPYTITIKGADNEEDVVLRKLAIAYYRCTSMPTMPQEPQHDNHAGVADHGIGSDRVGQPAVPERDKMDEDRGI